VTDLPIYLGCNENVLAAGLYVSLFHGRMTPSQEMHAEDEKFDANVGCLQLEEGCIVYRERCSGDWTAYLVGKSPQR
jgi:hypothetical protein